ncbi:hypothetical protein CQ13_31175 [Bradyrhizobium retamae]|uniref:Uncharacterized protein n=1 Tax=Bradyrhizobium retamae TaxID=1300035 RepID=A0A0R3MTS2_9BRAD|nr:hypothetical protein CQ13_31175 [Bradyrhizobium retamae]
MPIKDRCQIKEAIRTKLVLEVSSQTPEWKTVPVVEELRVNCWPEKKCTTIGVGDGLSRINTAGGGTGAHILLSGIS